MFEKSPSAFGVEPAQVRGVPQRREPQLTGTVITPWRSSLQDLGSRSQVTANIRSRPFLALVSMIGLDRFAGNYIEHEKFKSD